MCFRNSRQLASMGINTSQIHTHIKKVSISGLIIIIESNRGQVSSLYGCNKRESYNANEPKDT